MLRKQNKFKLIVEDLHDDIKSVDRSKVERELGKLSQGIFVILELGESYMQAAINDDENLLEMRIYSGESWKHYRRTDLNVEEIKLVFLQFFDTSEFPSTIGWTDVSDEFE